MLGGLQWTRLPWSCLNVTYAQIVYVSCVFGKLHDLPVVVIRGPGDGDGAGANLEGFLENQSCVQLGDDIREQSGPIDKMQTEGQTNPQRTQQHEGTTTQTETISQATLGLLPGRRVWCWKCSY